MSTSVVSRVNLAAEATTGVDITLQAGAITERVTVTSDVTAHRGNLDGERLYEPDGGGGALPPTATLTN
jgi:hypothetical protein